MRRRRSPHPDPLDVWWAGEAPVIGPTPSSSSSPPSSWSSSPPPSDRTHPPRRRRGPHAPATHPAPPAARPGLGRPPGDAGVPVPTDTPHGSRPAGDRTGRSLTTFGHAHEALARGSEWERTPAAVPDTDPGRFLAARVEPHDLASPGGEWARDTRLGEATGTGPAGGRAGGRERRVVVAGRAVGRAVAAAIALGVAWVVLVVARRQPGVAYRDPIAARLDEVVAEGLAADHVLSVATWVGYLATTVLVGGLVVGALVAPRRRNLPLGAVVVAGLASALVAVPLRATAVSGAGWAAIADPDVARHVATSPFGGAIALRVAGLLLVAATLGRDRTGRGESGTGRRRWAAGVGRVVGGGVLVASYLVVGHAQATDPVVVEVVALAVHVLAAVTWFGGVVVLARALRPRSRWGRLPAAAVARFSRTAEVMVVLVLVSGLVLAEGQGVLTSAPWRTGYGLAFTVKLAFVGVVLAIGGWNRQRVVPAIAERDDAAARRHLRSTCVAEALVISMGVLLMTAAMTSGGL